MVGTSSKPKKQIENDSIERVETFDNYYANSSVGKYVATEGKNFWNEIVGQVDVLATGGELIAGQELILDHAKKAEVKKRPNASAGIDYAREIIDGTKRIQKEGEQHMSRRFQEIKQELKVILVQSQELKKRAEFANVTVEQTPQQIGKYYDTFFDWLLLTIRQIRQQVEDSSNWLNAINGKKKKQNYWGMFKKHGTQFGLSGERSVSNQVA